MAKSICTRLKANRLLALTVGRLPANSIARAKISMRRVPSLLPHSRRLWRKFCHLRLPALASSWGVGKRSKNIQAETLVQSSKASKAAGKKNDNAKRQTSKKKLPHR